MECKRTGNYPQDCAEDIIENYNEYMRVHRYPPAATERQPGFLGASSTSLLTLEPASVSDDPGHEFSTDRLSSKLKLDSKPKDSPTHDLRYKRRPHNRANKDRKWTRPGDHQPNRERDIMRSFYAEQAQWIKNVKAQVGRRAYRTLDITT